MDYIFGFIGAGSVLFVLIISIDYAITNAIYAKNYDRKKEKRLSDLEDFLRRRELYDDFERFSCGDDNAINSPNTTDTPKTVNAEPNFKNGKEPFNRTSPFTTEATDQLRSALNLRYLEDGIRHGARDRALHGSAELKISKIDRVDIRAVVHSKKEDSENDYAVSLSSCTCRHFLKFGRQYPCKHIIFLADELGLIVDDFKPQSTQ